MNIINLVIGDWSGDGHDKRQTITIESNLTLAEITNAYNISGISLDEV